MHYVHTATITTVVAASHSFALRTAVSRAIRTHRQELVLNRDNIAKYGSTEYLHARIRIKLFGIIC